MNKKLILIIILIIIGLTAYTFNNRQPNPESQPITPNKTAQSSPTITHPMSISALQNRPYPGSQIQITQTLDRGSNYSRYIASYESDGNTIYGLLTIPDESTPNQTFPLIVFIHGYIQPDIYKTTERYVAYQDNLAKSSFITYKIDLRGHGNSEGEPGGHFSESYTVDTLNAIASLKKIPKANPEKIGIWGHSNGGEIGLRTMAVSNEVDAGVFWAGVVGSFQGMLETYNDTIPFLSLDRSVPPIVTEYGLPSENPEFWNSVDPYSNLDNLGGPIQLHHGTNDKSVPLATSLELKAALEKVEKPVEYYEYQGADHNLSNPAFTPAMQRTLEFFNTHLVQNN